MNGQFVMKKNKVGEWYYIVTASNGKTLCMSESYSSHTMCRKGIFALERALKGSMTIRTDRRQP